MPEYNRSGSKLPHPGPWLAIVRNHLDPTYMGGLEVSLLKSTTDSGEFQGETFPVQYLSPFYGVSNIEHEGPNSANWEDAQKSYGFWMVPPDIGTTVMVMFVGGDPNAGYWIGCIQDRYQNHMVPGIASSQYVEMTPEQERKYGTRNVPVTEFTKKNRDMSNPKVNQFNKPIHPFADRLLAQGLLLDTVRGVTSSSARRELPSQVFGISTPGPIKKDGKTVHIGYADGKFQAPVSRLGGTTFVMDDGDVDGQNELVRLRTRTGHQILMHNSQDLIYIANAAGTAWIELTSNGKIDVYAQDSISLHTENDFNLYANRDINFESGRNINIKSNQAMDVNVTDHFYMLVENNTKINLSKTLDLTVGDTTKITVNADMHIAVSSNLYQTASDDIHIAAGGSIFEGATSDVNILAGAAMKQTSGANFNVRAGGQYLESAPQIHMNGPAAASAANATDAQTADIPSQLPTFRVPQRSSSVGWAEGKFYKSDDLVTILQRVPMHEPWEQHENINPKAFTPQNTDSASVPRPDVIPSDNAYPPANLESTIPGTCSPAASKAIGSPKAQPGIAALKAACAKYGLTSPYAVASLLGIAGGESGWVPQAELYYYTPERLRQIFRSASDDVVNKYAKWTGSREEFFSFFYGPTFRGANFLGNQTDSDGGKYYGRGYIQLTGKGNYARYAKLCNQDLVNNPDLVNDISIGAEVAVVYFKDRVKLSQTDPAYFQAAIAAVGFNSPDIKQKKTDYYTCFLAQLQGNVVSTGSGGVLTDSQGNPVKTGSSTQ